MVSGAGQLCEAPREGCGLPEARLLDPRQSDLGWIYSCGNAKNGGYWTSLTAHAAPFGRTRAKPGSQPGVDRHQLGENSRMASLDSERSQRVCASIWVGSFGDGPELDAHLPVLDVSVGVTAPAAVEELDVGVVLQSSRNLFV